MQLAGPNSFAFANSLGQAEFGVSDIYFLAQLLAFNSAWNSFQVRPFRYATELLVAGFFAALVGGSLAGASFAAPQTGEWGPNLVYVVGLAFGAATDLAAGVGFRRLRKLPP